jgi:hypothetical protein
VLKDEKIFLLAIADQKKKFFLIRNGRNKKHSLIHYNGFLSFCNSLLNLVVFARHFYLIIVTHINNNIVSIIAHLLHQSIFLSILISFSLLLFLICYVATSFTNQILYNLILLSHPSSHCVFIL